MRDEIFGRIWVDHHDDFSQSVDAAWRAGAAAIRHIFTSIRDLRRRRAAQ